MASKKKGLLDTAKDFLKRKASANKTAKKPAAKKTTEVRAKINPVKDLKQAKAVTKKQTKAKTGVKATGGTTQAAKTIASKTSRTRNLQGTKALPAKKTGAKTGAAFLAGVGVGAVGTKKIGTGKKSSDGMSFDQAFKSARKEMGTDKVFTWRGKKYSTVTMDEVKKAGFKTLAEYNANKRSKSPSKATSATKSTKATKASNNKTTKTRTKPGMDYDPTPLKDGGSVGGGRQSRQNRRN